MSKKLFGVSGRIASGKDEVTRMLRFILDNPNSSYSDYNSSSQVEFSYEIRKFADKLKDFICLLINCTREQLEDREFKEKPIYGFERIKVTIKTHCGDKILYFPSYASITRETLPGGKLYNVSFKASANFDNISPRKLMQIFGSEAGRDLVCSDFWAKSLFMDYTPKIKENGFSRVVKNSEGIPIDFQYEVEFPKWIISDLRYPNDEGDIIKTHNGITIGVKRKFILSHPSYSHLINEMCPYEIPNSLNYEDPELFETLTFESEEVMGDLSWCDFVIENNGTLEELFDKVKKIVNENCIK